MAKTAAKNTTPAAANKAPRAPRKGKKSAAADTVQMNMLGAADLSTDDSIDALLANLTGEPINAAPTAPVELLVAGDEAGRPEDLEPLEVLETLDALEAEAAAGDADEVIEPALQPEEDAAVVIDAAGDLPGAEDPGSDNAPEVALTDAELNAALGQVEATQAALDASEPGEHDPAAAPTGDTSDAQPIAAADALEAAAAAKTTRKHYSDKVERIKDRLGASAADYTVLTLDDANVDPARLAQVVDDTFSIIKGMNKKEQNRASLLFDFLTGKKATLNKVLETTLRVLHRDGHVTTGKDSNLIKELLNKPYSMGSARAMSGNTIGMYSDLMLLKEDGKGRFIANPGSTLLAAANAKLGLVAGA